MLCFLKPLPWEGRDLCLQEHLTTSALKASVAVPVFPLFACFFSVTEVIEIPSVLEPVWTLM